ncbi:DUF4003 family protein [Paraclostridium sordellii]|uniref:DUF4003 family protein n=1 Tax=Paraclostridium sordellii TaxID=1505 RepID=A0A9P1P9A3_PARSO|nr:DUF4003 family protein [Paeniclostridium sordellii]CEK34753.1 hypothetical protein UMC2_17091 [[Clostridium] sordellii] [Paeniclostridium sordellii]CEO32177.1 Uncharacterised protein [[Clostridium] sordellii] [Paeniclostridium sordellii]
MDYKVKLLTNNFDELKQVKSVHGIGMVLHGCALSYTVKNKNIDHKHVNNCIDLIRENTTIFSDFRGNTSVNTAVLLSYQPNPKESLDEILEIHKKLRHKKFYSSYELALVANMIYENKENIHIDEFIENMKFVNEKMRLNHPCLTSVDDYLSACTITLISKNIEQDLENMEKAYEYLSKNGFHKNNTLQSLSQVISLTQKENIWRECKSIKKELERSKCKFHEFGYPLIGVIALLELKDIGKVIRYIKETSNILKNHEGYGNFSLGERYRNVIGGILVVSKYTNDIDINQFIIDKVIEDINKGMNIAITTATTSSILTNTSLT